MLQRAESRGGRGWKKKGVNPFERDIEYIRKAREHGTCTPEQRQKCRAEYGQWLGHNCGECKAASGEISQYTEWLFQVIRLQDAGCPVKADDLSLEQWLDLASLKELLNTPVRKNAEHSKVRNRNNRR